MKPKKVVIGMSGGVDSSVAAYLLKQQGYNAVGLFMRNWDSFLNNDFLGNQKISQNICPQEQDFQDAQKVAKSINIPLYRVDFIEEYWEYVFENFISEYKKGRTPNPDILCNKYIKFNAFLKYATDKLEADYIAMGHYAKVKDGKLYRPKDREKDQTYFLSQLSRNQLLKVIMPLENLTKKEVREIASKLNLITSQKKDSTGICFIGERKFTKFLQNYIPAQKGNIVSIVTNKIVGVHEGCFYYTIGQRKGLNLGGMSEPHYVCGHNITNNILYVAPLSQPQYLMSNNLVASQFNIIDSDYNVDNLSAKFRYRQKDVSVSIKLLENNNIHVYYPSKMQSVTPGQQVVLYDGEKCIGGAVIEEVYMDNKKLDYL